MPRRSPKLRTVEKYEPPYRLNRFPSGFHLALGREIVYHLATRVGSSLEGADWEQVFARLIGARWKPSNVGLDDVVLEQTAWGAKTVKNDNPVTAERVRLISGRNSPIYSFGAQKVVECDPGELGNQVLDIWNGRVAAIRAKYEHLRTVVLLKADDLLEVAVFEFDTLMYPTDGFAWRWNTRGNLEGTCKKDNIHRFTWQPHGSQFTIIEDVPQERLAIRIKPPPRLAMDDVLRTIKFDPAWIEIVQ